MSVTSLFTDRAGHVPFLTLMLLLYDSEKWKLKHFLSSLRIIGILLIYVLVTIWILFFSPVCLKMIVIKSFNFFKAIACYFFFFALILCSLSLKTFKIVTALMVNKQLVKPTTVQALVRWPESRKQIQQWLPSRSLQSELQASHLFGWRSYSLFKSFLF